MIQVAIIITRFLLAATALAQSDELMLSGDRIRAQYIESVNELSINPEGGSLSSIGPDLKNLFDLHNKSRESGARCGSTKMSSVSNLQWSRELASAAQQHVVDMENNGFMTHNGSNGSAVGQRATNADYIWRSIAENIAQGLDQAEQVYLLWVESRAHCNNIMSDKHTEMGAAKRGNYWVVVFGHR
jgi:uncharacterized protein YkwD